MLSCKEFVNADEIAKGLSPFQPETVAIEAGRIMLNRIKDLIKNGGDFAFETTLATRSYTQFVKEAQANGYFFTLVYFWLNSPDLAIARVNERVLNGGHNIPEDVIRRRYKAGIENFFNLYHPICDYWLLIDNSEPPFKFIAEGFKSEDIEILDSVIFDNISKI